MAMNVFGNPITDATLKGMPDYADKVITRKDRATVALNRKNASGNDVNVLRFVDSLPNNNDINTRVVIYNATGDTIHYVSHHDWYGHVGDFPYPASIANGQWAGFVHIRTAGRPGVGSEGGVVYRGKNQAGDACDWMFAWRNPCDRVNCNNSVYTEIHVKDHFWGDLWRTVFDFMINYGELLKRETWNGCISTASIGNNYSTVAEGIFTLENA